LLHERSALQAVFFDLDGTLADTAPDLAVALNRLRAEAGLARLPLDSIRPKVSGGTPALLGLAFDRIDLHSEEFQRLRTRFLALYGERVAEQTLLFPGMEEVLSFVETGGLPWGVVTNKPGWLTHRLLDALDLSTRARCIVSGDTTTHRKPHPAPLLHAADLLSVKAAQCAFAGDARDDIVAGHKAGMKTLVARFGYIDPSEDTAAWGADGEAHAPADIVHWLRSWTV